MRALDDRSTYTSGGSAFTLSRTAEWALRAIGGPEAEAAFAARAAARERRAERGDRKRLAKEAMAQAEQVRKTSDPKPRPRLP